MVRWHYRLSGRELELSLGDGEEQESLACYIPRQGVSHDFVAEQ